MTGMALWFTDPLAREVEPTKIPGVTATTVLVVLASSVLVWQFSSSIGDLETSKPNWRIAVVLWKQF